MKEEGLYFIQLRELLQWMLLLPVMSLQKKAFVIAGGSFGYRWHTLCEYYHVPCDLFEVPFAQDIDYVALEAKIRESHPDVLLCQHNETSSGQLFNLEEISQAFR